MKELLWLPLVNMHMPHFLLMSSCISVCNHLFCASAACQFLVLNVFWDYLLLIWFFHQREPKMIYMQRTFKIQVHLNPKVSIFINVYSFLFKLLVNFLFINCYKSLSGFLKDSVNRPLFDSASVYQTAVGGLSMTGCLADFSLYIFHPYGGAKKAGKCKSLKVCSGFKILWFSYFCFCISRFQRRRDFTFIN